MKASAPAPVSLPSSQSCRNFRTLPTPRLKPFSEVHGPRLRRVGALPPLPPRPLKRPLEGGVYHSTHSSSSVDWYISCSWSRRFGCRRKSSVSSGEAAIDAGLDWSPPDTAPSVGSWFVTPFCTGCSVSIGVDDSFGACCLGAQ